MTCQECQPLAIDLARGLPPFDVGGAVQRSDVLSHIARCKRCAEWLKEQEALSEALRAVAEADASLSAPPSVEANVMAAWRARQAPHLPARPAWRASAFAAAAAIVLLAVTLASMRWLNPPATGVVTSNSGANNAAANNVASKPATSSAATSSAGSGGRVVGHSEGTHAAAVEVLPDKRTKGRPSPPRVMATRRASTTRAMSVARGGEFNERAFVLLPYVEPLRPTEMRHIMRVRMPRTQFEAGAIQASDVDGATVLADVLVGEDGTARAVRIVQ